MQITGITPDQFDSAVMRAGIRYGGNLRPEHGSRQSATRFRARVLPVATGYRLYGKGKDLAPGQRRSWNGQRINAVCWHAYRDVMYAVFAINPKARIATALAIYRGLDDFERKFPATGDRNIGSMMAPAYMPELCECER